MAFQSNVDMSPASHTHTRREKETAAEMPHGNMRWAEILQRDSEYKV
jgi:hypothetical protein